MEKYIRVNWPESQKYEGRGGVISSEDDCGVFCLVPEDLYKSDNSRRLSPTDSRCKNCVFCIYGKHSKNQWWKLLVCEKQPKGDGLFKATSAYKGKDCKMFKSIVEK